MKTIEEKRNEAWDYLNRRGISVLRHGFVPPREARVEQTVQAARDREERVRQLMEKIFPY